MSYETFLLTDHTVRLPLAVYRPDLIPTKGTPEAILSAAPDLRECYRALRNEAISRAAQGRGEAWLTGAAVACLIGWRYQRAEAACAELESKGWLIARVNERVIKQPLWISIGDDMWLTSQPKTRGITEWKVRL